MKSIYYLSLFVLIFMISNCNKDDIGFVPENEVPQWLKESIKTEEAEIAESDPKSMINYGSWLRYKFENDYYFEYENGLSSVCCHMFNFEGDYYNYSDIETYYEKCCRRYVWKAPGHF